MPRLVSTHSMARVVGLLFASFSTISLAEDRSNHWSFVPPTRPGLPSVKDPSWPRNAIDRFILDRLEAEGLKPSPEADRTRR